MDQEVKALAEKAKSQTQPTKLAPENGNAPFFLIFVIVISLFLVIFSIVYKFRKRNR